jgi:hypothetical protein
MSEIGADLSVQMHAQKEAELAIPSAHVWHITEKGNIPSIQKDGIKPAYIRKDNQVRKRVDAIIDFYAHMLKVPADRRHSIFAFRDDPREIDADNLPYKPERHAVIDISVDPTRVYIADAKKFDDVFEYYATGDILKAQAAAIRYCKSIRTLASYDERCKDPAFTMYEKTEILIPEAIKPNQLSVTETEMLKNDQYYQP